MFQAVYLLHELKTIFETAAPGHHRSAPLHASFSVNTNGGGKAYCAPDDLQALTTTARSHCRSIQRKQILCETLPSSFTS